MKNKERRLHGYLYKHNITGYVQRWDTYGQEQFNSVTGGVWELLDDNYFPFPW